MSQHVVISPAEVADRLASANSSNPMHAAPTGAMRKARWRSSPQNTLRGVNGRQESKPSLELHSREAPAPVFADLNKYEATTHFVSQSIIFALFPDRATGEAYCLAHYITANDGKRRLMFASLRYCDRFVKQTVLGYLPSVCSTWIG